MAGETTRRAIRFMNANDGICIIRSPNRRRRSGSRSSRSATRSLAAKTRPVEAIPGAREVVGAERQVRHDARRRDALGLSGLEQHPKGEAAYLHRRTA